MLLAELMEERPLLEDALDRATRSGRVRILSERIGEVRNLVGFAQVRSLAALYAKRYRNSSVGLRELYGVSRLRELTPDECREIALEVGFLRKKK